MGMKVADGILISVKYMMRIMNTEWTTMGSKEEPRQPPGGHTHDDDVNNYHRLSIKTPPLPSKTRGFGEMEGGGGGRDW